MMLRSRSRSDNAMALLLLVVQFLGRANTISAYCATIRTTCGRYTNIVNRAQAQHSHLPRLGHDGDGGRRPMIRALRTKWSPLSSIALPNGRSRTSLLLRGPPPGNRHNTLGPSSSLCDTSRTSDVSPMPLHAARVAADFSGHSNSSFAMAAPAAIVAGGGNHHDAFDRRPGNAPRELPSSSRTSSPLPTAFWSSLPGNLLQRAEGDRKRRHAPSSLAGVPSLQVSASSWQLQARQQQHKELQQESLPAMLPSAIERFSGELPDAKSEGKHDGRNNVFTRVVLSPFDRLFRELRSRSLPGNGNRHSNHQRNQALLDGHDKTGRTSLHPGRVDQGLEELGSAIARVENRLSMDSSEAGQLRAALNVLRSEKESYMRERAAEAARVETISGEYDDMRRRAAVTEAGLSGSKRRAEKAEADRVKAQKQLSDRVGQLAHGLGREKERFAREMKVAATLEGEKGTTAVDEITRGYRERMRALSDSLASTQQQLTVLKADRDKQKQDADSTRRDLTSQVAHLEAQLRRAGHGVEKEKADMESVLTRLSQALSGVDLELTQSAGITPSLETSRALRRAQEDFRRDQRKIKPMLEKQRQRYDKASHVMNQEAQRLRARIVELNDLKAGLAESEGKQKHLRSNVAALGGTVSALDKELRKTRDALYKEQCLRQQAETALLSTEELRQQETETLWRELTVTRQDMTRTRMVYENTVQQRSAWSTAVAKHEQAQQEAAIRAETWETALKEEKTRNAQVAGRKTREIAHLKSQVVRASRVLAQAKAERLEQMDGLQKQIGQLNGETMRLEAQAQDGKKVVAKTVTSVSRRAFRNASNISKQVAPQGLLTIAGRNINDRIRTISKPKETGSSKPTNQELALPPPRPGITAGVALDVEARSSDGEVQEIGKKHSGEDRRRSKRRRESHAPTAVHNSSSAALMATTSTANSNRAGNPGNSLRVDLSGHANDSGVAMRVTKEGSGAERTAAAATAVRKDIFGGFFRGKGGGVALSAAASAAVATTTGTTTASAPVRWWRRRTRKHARNPGDDHDTERWEGEPSRENSNSVTRPSKSDDGRKRRDGGRRRIRNGDNKRVDASGTTRRCNHDMDPDHGSSPSPQKGDGISRSGVERVRRSVVNRFRTLMNKNLFSSQSSSSLEDEIDMETGTEEKCSQADVNDTLRQGRVSANEAAPRAQRAYQDISRQPRLARASARGRQKGGGRDTGIDSPQTKRAAVNVSVGKDAFFVPAADARVSTPSTLPFEEAFALPSPAATLPSPSPSFAEADRQEESPEIDLIISPSAAIGSGRSDTHESRDTRAESKLEAKKRVRETPLGSGGKGHHESSNSKRDSPRARQLRRRQRQQQQQQQQLWSEVDVVRSRSDPSECIGSSGDKDSHGNGADGLSRILSHNRRRAGTMWANVRAGGESDGNSAGAASVEANDTGRDKASQNIAKRTFASVSAYDDSVKNEGVTSTIDAGNSGGDRDSGAWGRGGGETLPASEEKASFIGLGA